MLPVRLSSHTLGSLHNITRSALLTATRQETKRQIHLNSPNAFKVKRWNAIQQDRLCRLSIQSHRSFHASVRQQHGGIERPEPGTGVKVTFRDSKGQDIKTVEVNEGDDLLSIAHEYDIDLEGAFAMS